MVAEADEQLMEHFFEAGTLTQDELMSGLKAATAAARLFPVVCASGLQNVGAAPLLDALASFVPSPAERPFQALAGSETVSRTANESAPYAAFVWKTVADQFAGRITLFRVYQGALKSDATVTNLTRGSQERLGHLVVLQGKTQVPVDELRAGDLGAVAKLKDTRTNDTIADKSAGITFAPMTFPEPVLSYAIEPKSRGDEDKISTSMHRLEEEDGTIRYSRDPQTNELLLAGQGQLHIEVTVAKLKRRFGVEVILKPPRIPYRETITARVEAHGRHKKQTGGHGQFGDCKIRMEPLPRGSDFEFVDEIFGGSIPRQFIPAVEKGDPRVEGARLPGRFPGRGLPRRAPRRAVSRRGLERALVQDRGMAGVQGRDVEGQADPPRAGDGRGSLRAERLRRRPDGRPERTPRAHLGDGTTRDHHRDQGAGADVRDADLRTAPHLGDRRPRLVSHGVSHYDEVPSHQQQKIVAAAKSERGQVAEEIE